nr:hypothetical protein CFP56_22751 [Quercus suber]
MIHSAILYLVVGFLHGRNGVLSELKKNYSFPLSARASLRCSFEVPRSAQSFVRSAKVIKFLKAEFHAILQKNWGLATVQIFIPCQKREPQLFNISNFFSGEAALVLCLVSTKSMIFCF